MLRRGAIVMLGAVLIASAAAAQETCPPDCPIKGGGSPSTDCLLEFGGVEPRAPGSRVVDCSDGDPSCDLDGEVNGSCSFEIRACLNNADPSLPTCAISGVERVRVRGGGAAGRELRNAMQALLPTSENVCTTVGFDVPIRAQQGPEIGTRRFSLSPASSFSINGTISLGFFTGEFEMHAGAPDPLTGQAVVDITDSSEYISADLSGIAELVLCIKPLLPAPAAGVIFCGRPSGQVLRVTASGSGGIDRDGLALVCRPSVQFGTEISQNHRVGKVDEEGFTEADCLAAGGEVEGPQDPHPGVCVGPFTAGQLPDLESEPGALAIVPLPEQGLNGIPVELTQESALPCGDEGVGMSIAFAFTTERSVGRIENLNAMMGFEPLEVPAVGENFSCRRFEQEDGPGRFTLAVPQLHLPILGDGITVFTFSDR